MDILTEEFPCEPFEQKNAFLPDKTVQTGTPSIEIETDGVTFRFSGTVDASIYEQTLRMIGGRL